MKTIKIANKLVLEDKGNQIRLVFNGDIVGVWTNEEKSALLEHELVMSALTLHRSIEQKPFDDVYATQIGGNSSLKFLFLWCKSNNGVEYKSATSIVINKNNFKEV